ncbi:hypothetical protein QWZ13_13920 [Reinekea marina]|nr:hypothetical protein [Reinekea marina]MDN3650013.1 hypothetical protein [Reinekea marina]
MLADWSIVTNWRKFFYLSRNYYAGSWSKINMTIKMTTMLSWG